MFTTVVKASRTTTSPMTALRWMPVASEKKLTTAEPSVVPVSNKECGACTPPPITRETAMASPRARPMASVMAAWMPDLAPGITARRTTCHRVPPSASAASRSATDTPCSAVRVRATMVGSIITARTTEASRMPAPRSAPVKRCLTRGIFCRKGSTSRWKMGIRTRSPQRPTMMLGTAASRSMQVDRGAPTRRGRNSERAAAVAMPTGTAMSRPTPVVIRVSMINTPAPNCSVSGFQTPLKMKLNPECRKAGAACHTKLTTKATTTAAKIRTPPQRMAA